MACTLALGPMLALLLAQATGQTPNENPLPSTASSVQAPPAAQVQNPPAVLQDGIPIKLRLLDKLDSHTAKDGDEIPFEVENDLIVNGTVILKRGSPVAGVVVDASASKTMGRAGRLNFTIRDVTLGNGKKIGVRAYNRVNGENRTGEMLTYMAEMPIAAAPFFLLMHGTNTVFPRGTEITAFVNGDVQLDLVTFQSTRTGTQ